ncbi:MAG: hypothetical protein ACE5JU_18305 [Candidatus Binatia bacterium]
MAYATGCHRMCKGDAIESARIAPDIMANGLRVDHSRHGSAAWAYYIDMVPGRWRSDPLVIFEVEAQRVVKVPIWLPQRADYAIMKIPGQALTYIPIRLLGFLNPPGFPVYNRFVGFF